ncbi:SDR family oxidoreductase [Desertivirga brevis]|uniref:SDR family oxidoreductase n=1 Tax=Desertivirga brevis TaxID=2810310 RepID=UPI001A96986C|nr:SDR family oxidoreductase [Pedobacter sp. SYSU D00873]
MQKSNEPQNVNPAQHQEKQPGLESEMTPRPAYEGEQTDVFSKLAGKVAIITGGDSGIGRAVAVAFARQGANVTIVYLDEHEDAKETKWQVEQEGQKCLLIPGDVGDEQHCIKIVEDTVAEFGQLDILVNNAAVQYPQDSLEQISAEQLEKTFRTNIFAYFYMAKAALKYLPKGGAIINTTSVTAYRGSANLIDYASTKGAIVGFTRSLAQSLADKYIRVNGVAPGPIWTPLIPSTFPEDKVAQFGSEVPLKRPGQPEEVAPCYVFLASNDSSYMTGQVLHPNGGEIVNG